MKRKQIYTFIFALTLVLGVVPAAAQDIGSPIPQVSEAELAFEQGLEAFEAGDYGMAFRRFRHIYERLDFNRRTTAALLMAGKALYREGQYEEAEEVLSALIEQYPSSRYLGEARQTIAYAAQQQELEGQRERVIDLGIALPLRDQDALLTQALFSGIRLAVEEHNEAYPDRPIRMIFRDTRDNPGRAREVIAELALAESADAIIGPLYSEEAEAAAAAAERAGVVLLAPLATDEAVSEERDYVFQANPTITMRGRQMARFALRSLGLRSFGVVAELGDSYSERMAEGFQEEALQRGADVKFFKLLEGPRDWTRLPALLDPAQLREIEALYLPITGSNAEQLVGAALEGLDAMGLEELRVLGNAEWHDLNPTAEAQASKYGATYTKDFYLEETSPALQDFEARYRRALGEDVPEGQAQRLVFTGYDVGRFLLEQIQQASGRPLPEVLRAAPPYEGLGMRIDFAGGNVNEALHYLRYRFGRLESLQ